ncbi:MAG: hypothetical protein LQ349_003820 [Xanthoria aureola]|nr:MAG: hypothetical protein LQ349_003820 [Xanthoria aureola]
MAASGVDPDIAVIETKLEEYKLSLRGKIRSFRTDPLHSAAYLGNLAHFLQQKRGRSGQILSQHGLNQSVPPVNEYKPFIYEYALSTQAGPNLTVYEKAEQYKTTILNADDTEDNELVFLAGRPSAEWLCAVGARYQIDHRFFHQHLNFLPWGQKDWFTVPTLPSRARNVIRLCVPSILFMGERRYVGRDGLKDARRDSERRLRESLRNIQQSTVAEAGRSIGRRLNIHTGDILALEQEISICFVERKDHWTGKYRACSYGCLLTYVAVLVWTDSGQDTDFDFIPAPNTKHFAAVADRLEFCPVFFENVLLANAPFCQPRGEHSNHRARSKQPLSSLPGKYGYTLDWAQAAANPLSAIQEVFTFHAAAELQYLNMLDKLINEQISETESAQEEADIGSILDFDYAKSILLRHHAHLQDLLEKLEIEFTRWNRSRPENQAISQELLSTLKTDLVYLSNRLLSAISLCEAGRSAVMSNVSVQESQRSSREAALVTGLTKATNRLTFIFLPLSFLTSVFGMNFRQLGQGTLSIWLWVSIALPLLAICIVMVERGSDLRMVAGSWVGRIGDRISRSI